MKFNYTKLNKKKWNSYKSYNPPLKQIHKRPEFNITKKNCSLTPKKTLNNYKAC